MPKKQIMQICTDVLMTGALLLLMSYGLLGEAAHEWVGMGVFALFILHHVLNRRWLRNLTRGRYTPYRVLQTGLVLLVLLTMLGAMISGILLSRTVFRWMHIRGLSSVARTAHMLCSYWGFVFVSLHLGFRRRKSNPSCFTGALSGAFWLVVVALRQQGCLLRTKNHSEISPCEVRSSFWRADFFSGKEKPAGNTLCIVKGFDEAWGKICRQKPTWARLPSSWSAMSAAVRSRLKKKPSPALSRVSRLLGLLFAGYGLVAFFRRDIGNYMLLRYHFVFFDFDEPLVFFLFDYLAVLFLFAALGYALCSATLKMQKNKKQ